MTAMIVALFAAVGLLLLAGAWELTCIVAGWLWRVTARARMWVWWLLAEESDE